MRILILHNFYQYAGGEDAVVTAEADLLANAGHEVYVETVTNDVISGLVAKLRTFFLTPHDPARKDWVRGLITRYKPDIVHIHNFFPLLTPATHEASVEAGVAVVQTLHNYRIICAGALLMRKGKACEKCLGGTPVWGIVHSCYRNSLPASLTVARMQKRALQHATWQRQVHRFIVLTTFAKEKFIEAGLPAAKIAVKPNFVPARSPVTPIVREGALFVGRISPEKGVDILVKAWENLPHIPLSIIGEGPELDHLIAVAPKHVRFLGRCSQQEVRNHMLRAQALIMPSLWYEGFPMTLVEAFSCRLPVIASRLGAMAELIEDGVTGRHFTAGDAADLAATAAQTFIDPATLSRMGAAARAMYDRLYTPERNLSLLENIYTEAISEMRGNHISINSDC